MTAANFAKAPWKHPAVWPAHLVVTKFTYSELHGITVHTRICECGWCACAKVDRGGAHHVAQDDAMEAHWREVIAEAEAVPA